MRIWWHKVKNWEYWPVYIIYMPTFFYWLWLMVKFKSFSFYKYSNPGIKNGGLHGDSKMEIYKLLPKGTFPKTHLITKNETQNIEEVILHNQFQFPLIVKPDNGLRGKGVKIVHNVNELIQYADASAVDFLIQERITYPNEIGLFYYRMPNLENGKISGITLKKFLTITGNGFETIEQLLQKKYRFKMQIKYLKPYVDLSQVLPSEKEICLVPFGNHCRGTQFLDGKKYITPKLENTMNKLLNKIDGFYFGRLDIRYNTLEELESGINFSIIELNGVKSEPTHIYDPANSFWQGQKEIFRHQMIMMDVVNKSYKLSYP